jgi:shikimate kinase
MKIFLIGLPGAGKTTLGKELAAAYGLPFVDLDAEIEKAEGKTIREIFEAKKEDYFRKAESKHLQHWCAAKNDFVMATGGGAPVFFDNLDIMKRAGNTIFLDVPAREIARRISLTKRSDRPLLAKSDAEALKDQIEFMRSQRIRFYRQAHSTFEGTEISAKEILEKIRKETQW